MPVGLVFAAALASMCSTTQDHCERASIAVSKLEKGSADFDFDTGWVPASSPIQIRIIVALHDDTQVDMAGTLDSTWPDPITLTPKGTLQQGHISINDGFEVSAQARFTVTVGGQTFSWTGDIPYVPSFNFLATGTQTFDPWQWTPSTATVSAQTPTNKIFQVPITSALIPSIPGISGGIELDGSATFSAWYDTLRIGFDETGGVSPIPLVDPTHADTRLLLSPTPSFDTNVFIHGEVTRQITLHFVPAFYFSILGEDFTLPLADLPLPLPASSPEAWDFDPVAVHVPLPQIDLPETVIDVGTIPVGAATRVTFRVIDTGEERLDGKLDTLAPMVDIQTGAFALPAQQTGTMEVLLEPQAEGPFDALVHVGTNDPLTPDSYVHLKGIAGSPIGDTGCGCRTVSNPSRNDGWLVIAGFALALGRKRQRSLNAATIDTQH